jgi:hypothetical protein
VVGFGPTSVGLFSLVFNILIAMTSATAIAFFYQWLMPWAGYLWVGMGVLVLLALIATSVFEK